MEMGLRKISKTIYLKQNIYRNPRGLNTQRKLGMVWNFQKFTGLTKFEEFVAIVGFFGKLWN